MQRKLDRWILLALGAGVLSSGASWAQVGARLHVSTTSDIQLGSLPAIDDATIIATASMVDTLPHFSEGHWQATTGAVPGDVDGFARLPGAPEGSAASMAFSFLSNEQGLLDGDILGFAPGGGLQVLISETQLVTALGAPSANIDVDALDFDEQGRLLFSLQSDLPGTLLGTVQDGDVLRLESGGVVTLVISEPEVQTMFTVATGLSASITDVQAIECWNGELWVVPQSPSSHDGAILACATSPYIAIEEADVGLGGAELDALSEVRPGDETPCFSVTPTTASAGDTLHVELHGLSNTRYLVLMSGGAGFVPFLQHPGFGAWYVDPVDPWLNAVIQSAGTPRVTLDSSGKFATDWPLPTAAVYGPGFAGQEGWTFQVLEIPTRELSAPFRVTRS